MIQKSGHAADVTDRERATDCGGVTRVSHRCA